MIHVTVNSNNFDNHCVVPEVDVIFIPSSAKSIVFFTRATLMILN